MKKLRIGITTRIVQADGYHEPRDSLASDWSVFFKTVLPEVDWVMLPNIGENIIDYVRSWQLNGFIISGGNDLGTEPRREATEMALLEYAVSKKSPLLGVCRGLQFLVNHYGGKIVKAENDSHAAKEHSIKFSEIPFSLQPPNPAVVNSYHNYVIQSSDNLPGFAFDAEERIEGVYDSTKNLLGIMWHPERSDPLSDFDQQLIKHFFSKEL